LADGVSLVKKGQARLLPIMVTVLERLQRLIALTESPNENEARNAAVLAVRLIRQHQVVLTVPSSTALSATRRASPSPTTRRRTPGSAKSKRVADIPAEIRSPLGGDCVECGGRYRAGSTIYWMQSGGGMHPRCFESWMKRK
jgi:hypothetical protein